MQINYDDKKINAALKDFVNATGINIQFLKSDLTSLGIVFSQNSYCAELQKNPLGKKACAASDKELLSRCKKSLKPEMQICHGGLADLAVPILYEQELVGYLILGQMKTGRAFGEIEAYLRKLGAETEQMRTHYDALPAFTADKIQSVARVSEMLAKYLLFENMFKPSYHLGIQNAVEYINANLSSSLSVEQIAKHSNLSKNALYRGFQKEFSMTVGSYITKKRMDAAERLLKNTDLSVEEISDRTGFSTAAYFGYIFKKTKGISPLKFRKENDADL